MKYDMQQLACAIIRQAIDDINNGLNSREGENIRNRARAFLSIDNKDFRHWCDIAGLPPDIIIRRIYESKITDK